MTDNNNNKNNKVEINEECYNRHDGPTLGSIDQGTSSTRYIVYNSHGETISSCQLEHEQYFPSGEDKVGWHEHDPMEIWKRTLECIKSVHDALEDYHHHHHHNSSKDDSEEELKPLPKLKAIGITNQRETLLSWNVVTGKPYYNAIVWDDLRTTGIANDIMNENFMMQEEEGSAVKQEQEEQPVDCLREETGLPIASYFSGTKMRWLIENVDLLKQDLMNGNERTNVKFGTIDTWLVYNLTGLFDETLKCNVGGLHITDVTNASRWLLMNLEKCEWDDELIQKVVLGGDNNNNSKDDVVVISKTVNMPEIRKSSEVYGTISKGCGIHSSLEDVPIASILGDQQAALFGQAGYGVGDAKCTYGTGMFLMMNTGYDKPIPSKHGLLSTVAYQLSDGRVAYALEGSVSHSGSVIQWLRDSLNLITTASQSEEYAQQTIGNDGMYFVPAFAGLFAPYWRSDARGCIVGLTASHNKFHLCRAALESAAFQARELFDAMEKDCAVSGGAEKLNVLKVDGGATKNQLLMQFQADMINVPVILPKDAETTAIGAAFAAGLAVGVWDSLEEIQELWEVSKTWKPKMTFELREKYWSGWKRAVSKSFGWIVDKNDNDDNDDDKKDEKKEEDEKEENMMMKEKEEEKKGKTSSSSNTTTTTTTRGSLNVGVQTAPRGRGRGNNNNYNARGGTDDDNDDTTTTVLLRTHRIKLAIVTIASITIGFTLGSKFHRQS